MFGPSLIVRPRTLVRLATALLICVNIASTIAQQTTRPQPVDSFRLHGDLGTQIDGVIQNWLLVAPHRNPQMLQMYRQRDTPPYQNLLPWSGEFAGKYLTACVEVLRISDNASLREHTSQFVKDLIACQDTAGYIGPFPREHQLTGWAPNTMGTGGDTWDAWGHYHVMLGLLFWHKLAGDEAALQCACKIADLLDQKFSGPDRTVLSTRSPEMNQAVIHSLAVLYQATSQDRYLNLAKEIVDEFAMPGAGDYFRSGLNGVDFYKTPKPRWESLHPILGLAELYWITGNEEYRTAVENLWWSIVRLDRHNNGGFSSGEQAQGDPYHQGPIETRSRSS